MAEEKMNSLMEKLYFRYILANPEYLDNIEPHYFQHDDIRFIYQIVRESYIISKNKNIPSVKQIAAMVKLHEDGQSISDGVLKSILLGNNDDYDKEDWLKPKFLAWKTSSLLKDNIMKSVDFFRSLKEVDYDNVLQVGNKIKQLISNMDLIGNIEDDLGDDFEDPESHLQSSEVNKISTGWPTLDVITNGGWGHSSLNLLIGETNVGKSMWLHNIAVKMADGGKNVLLVTLEMPSHECMMRMGSMRLKIPINEYPEKSKDIVYMKNKINDLKNVNGGIFTREVGKLIVKKFHSSSLTVTDLDLFITKLEEVKKIKIDAVLVDYLNIMTLEKGLDFGNMLYLKGKHLAEGLRYIADKHNVAMITATQTDKSVWGASDLSLKDIPESKAVAETSDSVFGIIRNPTMKKNNKYRLKILKLRNSKFSDEQVSFDFNIRYLTMENDVLSE